MSDVLIGTAARSAEALVQAKQIAEKVVVDNATGWYTPVKVDRTAMQLTPERILAGLKLMKKVYGEGMAAYLCGLEDTERFQKWVRKGGEQPNSFQSFKIRNAIEVTEILLSGLSETQAKEWMLTPNAYIDPTMVSLPMDELRADPELVRRAALRLLT